MSEVRRYDLETCNGDSGWCRADLAPSLSGDWVEWAAYKALAAERDRLARELAEARHHRRVMLDDDLKMQTLVALQRDLNEERGLLREWLEWGSQYIVDVDADGEYDISDQPITDLVMRTDAVFSRTEGAGNG